jgi:hypothetical protein
LPLGHTAALKLTDDPTTNIVVELPVVLWASPSEVSLDHFSGEIVRKDSIRSGLDERQIP